MECVSAAGKKFLYLGSKSFPKPATASTANKNCGGSILNI